MAEHNITYAKSPISEATCTIMFVPSGGVDSNVAESVNSVLNHVYDSKMETRSFQFKLERMESNEDPELVSAHSDETYIMKSSCGKRLLSLKDGHMSIHRMAPYESWKDDMLPRLGSAYDALLDCLDEPPLVQVLSVRYLNSIRLESETGSIELSDYFTVYPQEPEGFPKSMVGYNSKTVFECDDRSNLSFHFYVSPQTYVKRDALYMKADIEVQFQLGGILDMSSSELSTVASTLHARALGSFEGFVKDRYREEIS